jgi:hypothetical protein
VTTLADPVGEATPGAKNSSATSPKADRSDTTPTSAAVVGEANRER